jgi:hypothetical protein
MIENSIIESDIQFIPNTKVIVKNSTIRFRGVFSSVDIEEGELIERCPLLPLGFRSRYHSDPQIWQYFYTGKYCDCKECKSHGFGFYVALGYGSIYNHSKDPNAHMVFNYSNLYVDIISNKYISKNEEILVNFEKEKTFLNREHDTNATN